MELNVSWCDQISENGVEALARGCPKLRRFSSKGCKRVNNNAVICLATYCTGLEVLNLQKCDVSRTSSSSTTTTTTINEIKLKIPFIFARA